jgi:hypothetical protein
LEKIRRINGPDPIKPLDNKKYVTATNIAGNSSKNPNPSNAWFHYFGKNNHDVTDCGGIIKFKLQEKTLFESKAILEKKSLALLFEKIYALKR